MSSLLSLAALVLVSTPVQSPELGPLPEELPFPTKTSTLRTEEGRYFVSGRVRIESNVKIDSLRQMTLVGRGEEAVLEVAGKLQIKAATGGRVKVENLTILIMPECKDLLITETTFSGTGGLRTSPDGPAKAEIYLQNDEFLGETQLALKMSGGQVDLQNSKASRPVLIQGINPTEKNRAKLKVLIVNNKPLAGGLLGGLQLDNAYDALVRNTDLGGALTRIKNCRKLDFDGNHSRSNLFELTNEDVKDFKSTRIQSCDFTSPRVRIFAPADPKKPDRLERLIIHGGWFQGIEEPDAIRAKVVEDNGRDSENGMLVQFKRTILHRRGLGG